MGQIMNSRDLLVRVREIGDVETRKQVGNAHLEPVFKARVGGLWTMVSTGPSGKALSGL